MVMTMTNEQMGQMIDIMMQLNECGKLGYAIARNIRKLTDAAQEYVDMKQKLVQKYGTPSKDGKTATIKGENVKKYIEEMGDIPTIEHEADIYKIPEEIFYSGNLTSQQMAMLLWMVDDNNN